MNELPCILNGPDVTWCGKHAKKEKKAKHAFEDLSHAMGASRGNLIDCCPRCANAVIAKRVPKNL